MIDFLERALARLERALEWLVAALVMALVVIVASQLVDRHFITLPMAAPDAYARVILVWLTFVGFSLAVKNGINIRVDLIDARLPRRARRVLDVLFDLAMLGLTVTIGYHGWRLVVIGRDQERLGTMLSEAWPSGALFLSCILLSLFLLLRLAVRLSGREPPRHGLVEAGAAEAG
ncbi:MAG TPA: TRAP transporter small permease subunit [Burkholderiales bacterium]|nr:TRAP transporter small permease subunit [Burkholderiales bacterium]